MHFHDENYLPSKHSNERTHFKMLIQDTYRKDKLHGIFLFLNIYIIVDQILKKLIVTSWQFQR